MNPKLIKSEADYQATLRRIESIFHAEPGTPEGDELDLLVTLVEWYEEKAFPIDLPGPLAAIRLRMEQQGLKARDITPALGSAFFEILRCLSPFSLTSKKDTFSGDKQRLKYSLKRAFLEI